MELNLNVEQRELPVTCRKSYISKARSQNKIPGIVYGHGVQQPVFFDAVEFEKVWRRGAKQNALLNLVGAGLDGKQALVKDFQIEPIKRRLKHVDFYVIKRGEKLDIQVSFLIIGEDKCPGLKAGGTLNAKKDISLSCLPSTVPTHIEIDISNLHAGEVISVSDLKLPADVTVNEDPDMTIVTIGTSGKAEESSEATPEAAAPAGEGSDK